VPAVQVGVAPPGIVLVLPSLNAGLANPGPVCKVCDADVAVFVGLGVGVGAGADPGMYCKFIAPGSTGVGVAVAVSVAVVVAVIV